MTKIYYTQGDLSEINLSQVDSNLLFPKVNLHYQNPEKELTFFKGNDRVYVGRREARVAP